MAESNDRQGLPLKPGAEIGREMGEGLIGAEAISTMPGHPVSEKDRILDQQKQAALPVSSGVPVRTPEEMKEPEAKDEDEKDEKIEEPRVCPKCGWNQGSEITAEPSELDKANFMRAALTGSRFEKSFPMYGNRLRVTFRSRMVDESEDVSQHLQWEATRGNMDIRLLYVIANKMSMAMSLSKIEIFDESGALQKTQEWPTPTKELYKTDAAYEGSHRLCDIVHYCMFVKDKNVGDMMYNALYKAFTQFDELYQMMVARAEDPDFWSATPSVT